MWAGDDKRTLAGERPGRAAPWRDRHRRSGAGDPLLGSRPGEIVTFGLKGFQLLIESSCAHAYIGRNMAVPSVAAGIKGRPSSYLGRMLPPYTKPHLSFADQLALLMARGLVVTDPAKAVVHLERIGYGRLAPYWQPFQQLVPDPSDPARTIRSDQSAHKAGTIWCKERLGR